jgi:hypothetical protein
MRPIDPLSPLPQSSAERPRNRWVYILLFALVGAAMVWLLLARANAPEEGRVLEGRSTFVKTRPMC